jgi:hypothetical protein
MVGIPTYDESVAKVTVVTSTPRPRRRPRLLSSHPIEDDIAVECNDVERCSKDGEVMEEDMDSHNASTQYST